MSLKDIRLQAELTQEELAERSGVNQTTISAIERGQIKSPTYDTVVRLARSLGVPVDELFPADEVAHDPRADSSIA